MDRLERIDRAVDDVRSRYGYMSLQRALLYTDPLLGRINPKDDHTVHPVGFFAAAWGIDILAKSKAENVTSGWKREDGS